MSHHWTNHSHAEYSLSHVRCWRMHGYLSLWFHNNSNTVPRQNCTCCSFLARTSYLFLYSCIKIIYFDSRFEKEKHFQCWNYLHDPNFICHNIRQRLHLRNESAWFSLPVVILHPISLATTLPILSDLIQAFRIDRTKTSHEMMIRRRRNRVGPWPHQYCVSILRISLIPEGGSHENKSSKIK